MTDHSSALWRDIQDEIREQIERSLMPTGVTPGVWNGLTIDRYGRVLLAQSAASGGATGVEAHRTSSQATSSGAAVISWQATEYDTGSFYSGGSPTHLTFPSDGFYIIETQIAWVYDLTGQRQVRIFLYSSGGVQLYTLANRVLGVSNITTGPHYIAASAHVNATAGQYITVEADHTSSTSTLNVVSGGAYDTYCTITGPL
jgi:hypothetical protein